MRFRKIHVSSMLVVLAAALLSVGCAKKVAKSVPPAPPAQTAPAPTVAAKPSQPAPAPTAAAAPAPTDEELFAQNVKDVYFDYNKSAIRSNEETTAQNDAAFLKQHPSINVLVEGHCDDRGSIEYNLALGTSRAESIKQTLLAEGVPQDHVKTISYGKEKPFCTQDDEQCWQQNRVDHFTFAH